MCKQERLLQTGKSTKNVVKKDKKNEKGEREKENKREEQRWRKR